MDGNNVGGTSAVLGIQQEAGRPASVRAHLGSRGRGRTSFPVGGTLRCPGFCSKSSRTWGKLVPSDNCSNGALLGARPDQPRCPLWAG